MDLNDKFLSIALLTHFEESREALASRDSSNVEDEEDGGVPEDNEPAILRHEDHYIDTESFRCVTCNAPMCFTCGWCSAQCICPEKSR